MLPLILLVTIILIILLMFLLIKTLNWDKKITSIIKNKNFQKILAVVGIVSTIFLPINIFVLIFLLGNKFLKSFFTNKKSHKNTNSEIRGNGISDAYRTLGLKYGSGSNEIKKAYYNLMKKNHPDKGGSTYAASKLNQAKEILLKNKS